MNKPLFVLVLLLTNTGFAQQPKPLTYKCDIADDVYLLVRTADQKRRVGERITVAFVSHNITYWKTPFYAESVEDGTVDYESTSGALVSRKTRKTQGRAQLLITWTDADEVPFVWFMVPRKEKADAEGTCAVVEQ